MAVSNLSLVKLCNSIASNESVGHAGYAGHATIVIWRLTTACCSVVRLGWDLLEQINDDGDDDDQVF